MVDNSATGKSKGTYLMVLDMPEMMQAYACAGIKIPSIDFLKTRQQELASELQRVVPECFVETIEASDLTNSIVSLLHALRSSTPEAVVISTVRDVALKTGGHCIEINRLVDATGQSMGAGSRPGKVSLHSQINEIKGSLENHPVILVEDGSFSGGTMKRMVEICKELQIEIKHLVVGFLFPSAKDVLSEVFPNIENIHAWREDSFLDWMPDHDFYPFIPNAGRVVGFSYDGRNMPVYLHNGLCLCRPYILPYGNPVEWASIPVEHAKKFSAFCMQQTRSIFHEMERLNKRKITLENIVHAYPHIGLPICNGDKEFPHIKTRILDTLLYHEHSISFV